MSRPHLVVDLGGVLFHFDHARRLDRLAELFSLPPDRVDELLWRSGFSADCDRGRYRSAAEVRTGVRAATGFSGGDEELDAAWCDAFRPDRAALDQVSRSRGTMAVAVFTNNGPLEEAVLPHLYPEAFEGADRLLFSHRLGHRKPEPAAYAAATARLGADPGEIVFVDDSPRNVEAARAFGWTAARFDGPETFVRTLGR
jgi:putative hydrolase of the HAD superfamily